jgi:hypothetical protein
MTEKEWEAVKAYIDNRDLERFTSRPSPPDDSAVRSVFRFPGTSPRDSAAVLAKLREKSEHLTSLIRVREDNRRVSDLEIADAVAAIEYCVADLCPVLNLPIDYISNKLMALSRGQ